VIQVRAADLRLGNALFLPRGTDGVSDGITLKGEFQVDLGRLLRWFFGLRSPLTRRDWALIAYSGWLVTLFALMLAAVVLDGPTGGPGPVWPLAALAASALIAERQSVRLSPRAEVSVSFLPIVLAAVIYGPFGAICVSFASLLFHFQQPYARWLIWTSSRSIAAGCAGAVAIHVDSGGTHAFGRVAAAVAAATVVELGGDLFLGSVVARLRGMPTREIARIASSIFIAMPLYAPMTALLVYAYRELSPWSVALFLFPAFAAQKLFLLYREQRATAEELAAAMERQERANLSFATALVATLDARDRYTAGHSAAVAVYARDIAARLGLSESEQRLAHLCGLVHDIGKVGLPAGLLEKPGPLTLDERRQMEQHPVIGERILGRVEDYGEIAQIVRHHHERVDGGGYPDGIIGGSIPIVSRIIAVADAYNAMTSHRPYRDAMPSRVARVRLAQAVETQFDTAVVAAFEAVLVGASEEYRAGSHTDFEFSRQERAHVTRIALAG
jgi:putative nucleotidyltransferase with HDIG domain